MIDIATLQAALVGYQARLDEITAKMHEIRKQIGQPSGPGLRPFIEAKGKARRKKRALSAAARKRIAAAQKKRWAAYRAAKKGE
jgi:hypothetical protein